MQKEIQLERFRRDKLTKEESLVPFSLCIEDVLCLYRDRNGSFVITRQGFANKVPYRFDTLREYLGI